MIKKNLEDRLKEAGLHERIESLLSAVEDANGDLEKADAAEYRFIEEVRKIGNEAMHAWANAQAKKQASKLKTEKTSLKKHQKKTLVANDIRDHRR